MFKLFCFLFPTLGHLFKGFLISAPLANSSMMSTIIVCCQWEEDRPPSFLICVVELFKFVFISGGNDLFNFSD